MKDTVKGFGYLREGIGLMRQPGLRRYVAVPLLVSTLVFTAAIYFSIHWLGILLDWLLGYLPGWLEWLRYLLWPLFALTGVLLVFYTFALITNLIAAPFNGLLAEAVERYLTGQPVDEAGGWKALLNDVIPSILSELRKLLYFIVRALPLVILFLVPGVNLAAPFLWALFSAWMLAIEYADYPMGNHRMHFAAQRECLRRRRLLAFGFGGGSLLLTMIPLVNFIAMPASVAGATAMWVREFRK
ncbi:MAG: sulfate transporter CysZ [Gammaproteobacteria bacterium]|nr:MAG: sulfate transporter CysZ [Gammaproteobacteria bacterium]